MTDWNKMLKQDAMTPEWALAWLKENPQEALTALKKKAKEEGKGSIYELFPGTRPGESIENFPIESSWLENSLIGVGNLMHDVDRDFLGGIGGTHHLSGGPTHTSIGMEPSLEDLAKDLDPKILKELARGSEGPIEKKTVEIEEVFPKDNSQIDYRSTEEKIEDEAEDFVEKLYRGVPDDPDAHLAGMRDPAAEQKAKEEAEKKKTLDKPASPYGKYQAEADLIKNMRNSADAMSDTKPRLNASGGTMAHRAKANLDAAADWRQTKLLEQMKNDDRKSAREKEIEQIKAHRKKFGLDNPAPEGEETVKEGTIQGQGFEHTPPALEEGQVARADVVTGGSGDDRVHGGEGLSPEVIEAVKNLPPRFQPNVPLPDPAPAPIPDGPDVGEFQSRPWQPRTPVEYPEFVLGGTPGQDAVVDLSLIHI